MIQSWEFEFIHVLRLLPFRRREYRRIRLIAKDRVVEL